MNELNFLPVENNDVSIIDFLGDLNIDNVIKYPTDPIIQTLLPIVAKGSIVDEYGNPLFGASIQNLNNKFSGTTADFDGNFEIEAAATDVLEIRYLGFETQQIAASKASKSIVLKESAEQLNEVVITATLPKNDVADVPEPKTDNTMIYAGIGAAALLGFLLFKKSSAGMGAAKTKRKRTTTKNKVVKRRKKNTKAPKKVTI